MQELKPPLHKDGVEAGHAEGKGTVVSHNYSHAQGFNTKTGTAYQNVQGKFNVGKSNTLLEVGMGTSNTARSNAFEVTEVGDVYAGRSNGLTNDLKLPTGADVISYLNSNLNAYCTPFQFPNSNVTQRSFKFSGLGQNESIHLLLFLRYGAYEVRGFCGPSDFNSVLVGKLESNSVDLSVAPVSGAYQFALAVGQWTAGFGFFIHPHYPNAKLTIF